MRQYDLVIEGNAYRVEVEQVDAHSARVIVNGTSYEVDIAQPERAPAVAAPRPAPARPRPAPSSPSPAVGGSGEVRAPMPGLILAVFVAKGDVVTRGQVIANLEAMKMENDVVAPVAGKVTAVEVAKGAEVAHGQLLFSITPE